MKDLADRLDRELRKRANGGVSIRINYGYGRVPFWLRYVLFPITLLWALFTLSSGYATTPDGHDWWTIYYKDGWRPSPGSNHYKTTLQLLQESPSYAKRVKKALAKADKQLAKLETVVRSIEDGAPVSEGSLSIVTDRQHR